MRKNCAINQYEQASSYLLNKRVLIEVITQKLFIASLVNRSKFAA